MHNSVTGLLRHVGVPLHPGALSFHSFEDSRVHILAREDRWFERRVKEGISVNLERPFLNGGRGLQPNLLVMCNIYHIHSLL